MLKKSNHSVKNYVVYLASFFKDSELLKKLFVHVLMVDADMLYEISMRSVPCLHVIVATVLLPNIFIEEVQEEDQQV